MFAKNFSRPGGALLQYKIFPKSASPETAARQNYDKTETPGSV